MIEHKDIIDTKLLVLKKIHEGLSKEKYFGYTTEDAKQSILVSIFINLERELEWRRREVNRR